PARQRLRRPAACLRSLAMNRRRVAAMALLVACAAAVAVVVAGSGGRHHVARATAAGRAPPGRPHHGHARRPALPQAPAQVRGAAAERMHIPILMYHVVGTPKPGTPYPQLWVTPATFAAEMAALRRAGYYAVTVKQ